MVNVHHPRAGVSFPGKDSEEKFVFFFRQHWVRAAVPSMRDVVACAVILGLGALLFGAISIEDDWLRRTLVSMLGLFFLFAQIDILLHVYRYFLYVVVITDRKIHRIKKTLLVIDDHESIDLWVLQDIRKSQHGVVQNILGFGTLILEAQNTTLRLHFVPRIARRHEELMRLREQARASSAAVPSVQPAETMHLG